MTRDERLKRIAELRRQQTEALTDLIRRQEKREAGPAKAQDYLMAEHRAAQVQKSGADGLLYRESENVSAGRRR
jgi:hypothetical protein